jgi:hypothetical protein
VHGNVIPVDEGAMNCLAAYRIDDAQIGQRLVGQHHAPAKGVLRAIAFDDHDLVGRIAQLHGDREI